MTLGRLLLFLLAIGLLLVGVSIWRGSSSEPPNSPATPETAPASEKPTTPPIFVDITEKAGLNFVQEAGELERFYFPAIMGGGCALFDFNNDGLLDVYLINGNEQTGNTTEPRAPRAKNQLFQQVEIGRFVNVTEKSGLGDNGYGMGVAVGDINNDGFSDVYVTNVGADKLYLNRGDGTFRDVTESAGIENRHWAASASFVDFDRDGWLDLYVTNYVDYFPERTCPDSSGQLDFCGPQVFFSASDKLFRNLTGERSGAAEPGTVRFEDVSVSSGIAAAEAGAGLGVVCVDVNQDRWPDIYVANDRMANRLWINQQDGTFVDEAVFRGLAFDSQGKPQASMGIALGDLNQDALPDFYVTHFEGESHAYYLSQPGGLYSERSAEAGLLTPTFPFTGFGTAFVDVDQNGFSDILIVNGRVKRGRQTAPNTKPSWSQYAEQNQIFLNSGSPIFTLGNPIDPFHENAEVWRGLATGDLDNDGDLDLLATSIAGHAKLYRNEAPQPGAWLQVRAVDPRWGGRDALGAVITIELGETRRTAYLQSGTSYLSASQPLAHFGLGNVTKYDRMEVLWPDGAVEEFSGGPVSTIRRVERGTGKILSEPKP